MNQFPETLKTWRTARRFSQMDLALEADVSARHISFLETGRSQPSREMIARLGDALRLPLATRNLMLVNAGFAPQFRKRDWDEMEMAPIRTALEHTLSSHGPYPAIAIDRLWTIVRANEMALRLFGMLGVCEGSSLLDLVVSDVVPELVENWPEVAHHSAQRLRMESTSQGGVPELDEAADRLSKVGGEVAVSQSPVIPTIYRFGDQRLALFSTIAQFGTPLDLTLDDLKIELFFPADEPTSKALREMAGSL